MNFVNSVFVYISKMKIIFQEFYRGEFSTEFTFICHHCKFFLELRYRSFISQPFHKRFSILTTCTKTRLSLNTCPNHCEKSVRIQSYSRPYFPVFGLNTERYGIFIQSECGKMRSRITPNTDTFNAVNIIACKICF